MRSDIGLQGERVDQDLLGIVIFSSLVELVSMECPACTEEKNADNQNSLGSDFSSRSYFLFGLSQIAGILNGNPVGVLNAVGLHRGQEDILKPNSAVLLSYTDLFKLVRESWNVKRHLGALVGLSSGLTIDFTLVNRGKVEFILYHEVLLNKHSE